VSQREAEVLAALGAGLSNAQIARRLHISTRTVEGHVSSLLRKYGVADRRSLGALATTGPPGQVAGLPQFRTSFVGRERECPEVRAALRPGGLATLVGPGGVGKTRVAAQVAAAAAAGFPFGGAFVDLVPVRAGFLTDAVAAGLQVADGAQQPLIEAIVDRLARGSSLLVLDNCEHLIDEAADLVERVLSACPETAVLATSRERLGVPGERTFPVAPLPLGTDAERLFRERAALQAVPDPEVVSNLCARLDGLPLAIELAAARSGSLGATGLLMGLGDYLRLLAGGRGAVVRHRSLRGVIGWSYELLDHDEQRLFRRLSVFAGAFDLSAAAAVAGWRPEGERDRSSAAEPAVVADLLGRLVDKSLVLHQPGTGDRWRLLETIRAFASDQLDRADELGQVRRRHLRWATETADLLETRRGDQWQDRFDSVADDLRAALASTAEAPDQAAHRLAAALGSLAFARGYLVESLRHFRAAAARAPSPAQAADDLRRTAECAQVLNDSEQAFSACLEAAEQAVRAGDGNARALALARAVEIAGRFPVTFRSEVPYERLRTLLAEAAAAGDPDDPVVAARLACAAAWTAHPETLMPDRALAERAIAAARVSGDPVLISASLDAMRTTAITAGHALQAHRITSQRLALLDRMDPADPYAAPEIEDTLGLACSDAVAAGDLPAAAAAVRRLLNDDLLGDHPYLVSSKVIPALVLRGDLDLAVQHAATMWEGWQRAGCPPAFWMRAAVHFVALAHGLRGDTEALRRWRGRTGEIPGAAGPLPARLSPLASFVDARVALHHGDLRGAPALVARADAAVAHGRFLSYARATAAELAVAAGLPTAGEMLAAAQPLAEQNAWASACLARAAGRFHDDRQMLVVAAQQWADLGARVEWACTLLLMPDRAADGRAELASLEVSAPTSHADAPPTK
jgi:predicted ATPase